MSYPQFYFPKLELNNDLIQLNEETSHHLIQVLRMKIGEQVVLLNGKGLMATASIWEPHKKAAVVKVLETFKVPPPTKKITVAVSLLKNSSRFEWLLEKITEIGVTHIIPLITHRTESRKYKESRIHAILISALLQSQRLWIPEISEPMDFGLAVKNCIAEQKFIAHCEKEDEKKLLKQYAPFDEAIILIGPEGDFTPEEISLAVSAGFIPVSLGATRLRSETAGVVAAVWLCG